MARTKQQGNKYGSSSAEKSDAQRLLSRIAKPYGYLSAKLEAPGWRPATAEFFQSICQLHDRYIELGATWDAQCESDYLAGRELVQKQYDFRR